MVMKRKVNCDFSRQGRGGRNKTTTTEGKRMQKSRDQQPQMRIDIEKKEKSGIAITWHGQKNLHNTGEKEIGGTHNISREVLEAERVVKSERQA